MSDISLYVHIPFCSSRCRYCNFHFETGHSPRVMGATLDRILAESAAYAEEMGHPEVRSVYFGGGTPSVLPPELLSPFLDRFRSIWGVGPVEWTFEANPESLSGELLAVLAQHGVTRISVGVQTFRNDLLQLLGRRATQDIAREALSRTLEWRGAIPHVNIDLIAGIPGQNASDIARDIELACSFQPDHFSLYSLTIEDRTGLRQMIDSGTVRMARGEVQDELWFTARDIIEGHGFSHYEVSNFALSPDAQSAHNGRYWRLDPYLGLGPAAVSTIAREGKPVRIRNADLFVYGTSGWRERREVEVVSPRDFLFEHFVVGLRTREGVSLPRLRAIFGGSTVAGLEPLFANWRAANVAEAGELTGQERVVLRPDHRLILDRHLLDIKAVIDNAPEPERISWPPEPLPEPDTNQSLAASGPSLAPTCMK